MKEFKSVFKLKILFTAAIFIAAIALAGCKKDDPVKVSALPPSQQRSISL